MDKNIEKALRENLVLLARDPKRHPELRALAESRGEHQDPYQDLAEVKAAVERLLSSDLKKPAIDSSLLEAYLNAISDSEPEESGEFDSGACGGLDALSAYELPNGTALVYSLGSGWHGPYPDLIEALETWRLPTIHIDSSDDINETLSDVPEDVDSIKIDDMPYHRFDGEWSTDDRGPTYVQYNGTWMSEADALDAEESKDTEGADPA